MLPRLISTWWAVHLHLRWMVWWWWMVWRRRRWRCLLDRLRQLLGRGQRLHGCLFHHRCSCPFNTSARRHLHAHLEKGAPATPGLKVVPARGTCNRSSLPMTHLQCSQSSLQTQQTMSSCCSKCAARGNDPHKQLYTTQRKPHPLAEDTPTHTHAKQHRDMTRTHADTCTQLHAHARAHPRAHPC